MLKILFAFAEKSSNTVKLMFYAFLIWVPFRGTRNASHGIKACSLFASLIFEPHYETTGLWGFRPGPTQTGLYNHRRWQEA